MKYIPAEDLQMRMEEIVKLLEMEHVDIKRVKCFRSSGSSTKRTIARCHTIGKLMQKAIGVQPHYAIEFLEIFEKMPKSEQDKVIIHELLHIPKTFGGGFRQHDYVCEENVGILHEKFMNLKYPSAKSESKFRWFN
ncbi:MAG: putative metallopeptidase [archaeon]